MEQGIIKQVDTAIGEHLQSTQGLEDGEISENDESKKEEVILPEKPETERERQIRMGEMTPFGNVLGSNKSFEKYMEKQLKLQMLKSERKKQTVSLTKEKKKPKRKRQESSDSEYLPESDEGEENNKRRCPQRVPPVPKLQKIKSDEWHTDDEDWEDSDEEIAKNKRKGKIVDDGPMKDYMKRVAAWEKENSLEEIENNCRQLGHGFKVPNLIWDKLYK